MDKLPMQSKDLTAENFAKLSELFPQAVTETITGYDDDGRAIVERAVDPEALQQEINAFVLSGKEERYQFTWPDKRRAIVKSNSPATVERRDSAGNLSEVLATLRPCREESVNFDTTENLYIEGDNLDVLKLLRETYLGRVKMIYIDPPYNTGNDFVYNDDFAEDAGEFLERDGQVDEGGNRMVKNLDSNGRFHTDWLNMMYPRLRVARDLLTDDGVIFISIDDNEVAQLRKICDEVFGEGHFIGCFVWRRRTSSAMDQSKASTDHEYVFAYHKGAFTSLRGIEKDYAGYSNPDNDPRGLWTTGDLTVGMNADMRPNQFYDLVDPKTGKVYKPSYNRVWSYAPESMQKLIAEDRIIFPDNTNNRPMRKRFANELNSVTNPFSTWMTDVGLNTEGTRIAYSLFDKTSMFNYAKPVSLIINLIGQVACNDSIILDFFSGSATTAHATMQLNAEDGGKRKFIMVQLPEVTDEKSEAAKAGYATICEIGKERIRRAGAKIKDESPLTTQDLDVGFRVLKLDSTNMKDVYYTPGEIAELIINGKGETLIDNIKEDRSAEDLLFQVMLDLGVPLSAKMELRDVLGADVYFVEYGDRYLIACFGRVTGDIVTQIAKEKPYFAVFRDGGFEDDNAFVNAEQIFQTYSPETERRVL